MKTTFHRQQDVSLILCNVNYTGKFLNKKQAVGRSVSCVCVPFWDFWHKIKISHYERKFLIMMDLAGID